MGSTGLIFKFVGLVSLLEVAGCASKLVDVNQLDKVPSEFSQNISDYKTDIVDPSISVAPDQIETKHVPESNVIGSPPANKKAGEKSVFLGKKTAHKIPKEKAITKRKSKFEWIPKGWPYGIGEVAEYSLRYGLIEGGVITMKTLEPKVVDGQKALHYWANVKSTRLLELFYKVDDTIESWVTMSSHLPIRQEIQQRESAQWGTRAVTFDLKNQTAKFYATTQTKSGSKKIERFDSTLDHFAQDVFGVLYFWRFIQPANRVNFAIHDRGKNWSNETIYLSTDILDLPIGKTRARHYKLKPRIQGHLEPKGDVDAWFADDDTRILVRFQASIKFGTITGDLRKFHPGKKITLEPPRMVTPTDLNSLGTR